MDKDIINEIINELNQSISGKSSAIELAEGHTVLLNKENFYEIKKIKSTKKIAFIDGGNAEVVSASNFSLHFIRIYSTIYENNKRIKNKKIEFYALATALAEKNQIKFATKIFPLNEDKIIDEALLIFDSNDCTLRTGQFRFSISKIGEIARRLAELKIAADLIDDLNRGDFIVLDGDLEQSATNEDIFLKNLFDKSIEKGIMVGAISKTSRLFTDTGDSFNAALNQIAPDFPWYYFDKSENKLSTIFIKLNQKSQYIFKFEILNSVNEELLSLLMENSNDPIFVGYPYGLIEADKFARVSSKEKDYLQTVFIAKSGMNWKKFAQYTKSIDAHSILDRIS